MPLHRPLLMLICSIASLSGCVTVPQQTLSDGSPTPKQRYDSMVNEGTVIVGRSLAIDVAQDLLRTNAAPRNATSRWSLWQNDHERVLAIAYDHPFKCYGVTLNQHFFYIPMPMFGVPMNFERKLVLPFNEQGVLSESAKIADGHIGPEYRRVTIGDGDE